MGLRQRTAASMIRMQRRQAEALGSRVSGKNSARAARSVSFSQIDSAQAHRQLIPNAPIQRKDQDDSLRLLQRLRQALQPLNEAPSPVSKDYEALQDELQRLAQHNAKQKTPSQQDIWEDKDAPYRYAAEEGPDSLPYRTIRLVTQEQHRIERLDITPLDLSRYRQVFQETSTPARNLTLVSPDAVLPVAAKDLLIDEAAQLGHATANMTEQSLEPRVSEKQRTAINPKLALSLLDS